MGDPSYQDLQQINSTVTRQAGLVRKLLAFSRKQTFRMTVFDVSDVLSDCSVMLGQILEETVRLDIRHGRDLPLIRADRNQIDNILVNLATNARDAMKGQGGGTLTITTEAVDADGGQLACVANSELLWVTRHDNDELIQLAAELRNGRPLGDVELPAGKLLQVYVAVENVFDYTQADPLVDPKNPFGDRFDTAYVYGPIHGRCTGAGLRLMMR